MTEPKYGLVEWDEPEFSQSLGGQQDRAQFLRLNGGPNIVRLITLPCQYAQHTYKEEGDTGLGDRVRCSRTATESCPLCDLNDKPKRRWFVGVIDRKSGGTMILDIGSAVLKDIVTLKNDNAWGDPMGYDINIQVNKQGGATNYYSIVPRPKEPLSESDLKLKAAFDLEELKRLATPPTREKVEARFQAIRAKKNKPVLKTESVMSRDVPDFPAVNPN